MTQQPKQASFTPHFIEDILEKKIVKKGAKLAPSKDSRFNCGFDLGID